jgi:hypothetical protein
MQVEAAALAQAKVLSLALEAQVVVVQVVLVVVQLGRVLLAQQILAAAVVEHMGLPLAQAVPASSS